MFLGIIERVIGMKEFSFFVIDDMYHLKIYDLQGTFSSAKASKEYLLQGIMIEIQSLYIILDSVFDTI